MIHDILLSLFHPNQEMIDMYKIMINKEFGSDKFLHPSEIQTLQSIVEVIENYQKILQFMENSKKGESNPEENSSHGLYLKAFINGLDQSLDGYRKMIVDTEKRFLQNPYNPLSTIYSVVYPYNYVLLFLLKIINGINSQKLHGCAILQYMHQFTFQCEPQLVAIVQIIQSSVQLVFFQQLSQWLIYGKLVDKYSEFFILKQDSSSLTFNEQVSKATTTSSTCQSKESFYFSQYDVVYELLPQFVNRTLADDILFIGQTIIKFNSYDPEDGHDWLLDEDQVELKMKGSFWGDFEMKFFGYFGSLFTKTEKLNLGKFHSMIEEMKKYVTEHLYQIAKKDSDLLQKLTLIKDYYLLGRGDLFEEFIKECRIISDGNQMSMSAKDLNRAFQLAAHSLNVSEDLEQFTFVAPSGSNETSERISLESANINLKYKVKWPLHMIFSVKVIERYNEIFTFLLKIKKAQHDLQLVWTWHRERRMDKINLAVQLRNKLMFLIDNLFMYLQVDVIESRFNHLLNSIKNCEDFLVIQKEHSLFQITVLSHCFLLNTECDVKSDKQNEHEVLANLEQTLQIINLFCESQLDPSFKLAESQVPGLNSLESLNKLFDSLMSQLMNKLMGLKSGPNGFPLTQLLLRLNFNHNFSKNQ